MLIRIQYVLVGLPGNRNSKSVKTFILMNKDLMGDLKEGKIKNLEYKETEKDRIIEGIFTWEEREKITQGLL